MKHFEKLLLGAAALGVGAVALSETLRDRLRDLFGRRRYSPSFADHAPDLDEVMGDDFEAAYYFVVPRSYPMTFEAARAVSPAWGYLRAASDEAATDDQNEVLPLRDWVKAQRAQRLTVLRDPHANPQVVYAFTVPEASRVRDVFGYQVVVP